MSEHRVIIDNLEFAQSGGHLHGVVEVAGLERLHEHLNSRAGQLEWQLDGTVDQGGKAALRIAIQGTLDLICQRCLKGYAFDMHSASLLVLAEGEVEADAENGDMESIAVDHAFDVEALVEDEVLLALPMSPRHPDGKCAAQAANGIDTEAHPFAALAKLKKV